MGYPGAIRSGSGGTGERPGGRSRPETTDCGGPAACEYARTALCRLSGGTGRGLDQSAASTLQKASERDGTPAVATLTARAGQGSPALQQLADE